MAGTKPIVYWDSCVFIAFLKGDKPAEEIKAGLEYWTEKARASEATILTSTLTFVEVLRFKHEPEFRQFQRFMRRPVLKRAADHIVCQRAHDIRDHFARLAATKHKHDLEKARQKALEDSERKGKHVKPQPVAAPRKLATPDSIHLATASLYDCTAFHTFDGEGINEGKGFLKLLQLNGQIPGFSIPIALPQSPSAQKSLFDLMRSDDEEHQ